MRLAAGLLLALGACGRFGFSPGPPDDGSTEGGDSDGMTPAQRLEPYSSGTRLRAVTLGTGGARIFDHWFDTMTGGACTFRVAADGIERCLPSGPFDAITASRTIAMSANAIRASDAGCTMRDIAVWGDNRYYASCPHEPSYALVDTGTTADIFELSATVPTASYVGSPGSCNAAGLNVENAAVKFGPHVDPTVFVATATANFETDLGVVRTSTHTADDGATQRTDWHLPDGSRCWWTIDDGGLVCLPAQHEIEFPNDVPRYSDATCTTRGVAATGFTIQRLDTGPFACDARLRVFKAEGASPLWLIDRTTGACAPTAAGYAATEIDVATLPRATIKRESAAGDRVAVVVAEITGPERYELPLPMLVNATTGVKCGLGDDQLRCLPTLGADIGQLTGYSNATCTTSVGPIASACQTDARIGSMAATGPCDGSTYYAIGHVPLIATTYYWDNGVCMQADPAKVLSWGAGTDMAPTMPQLTLLQE